MRQLILRDRLGLRAFVLKAPKDRAFVQQDQDFRIEEARSTLGHSIPRFELYRLKRWVDRAIQELEEAPHE